MLERFRVIITGDRNWHCREVASHVVTRLLEKHGPALTVIHGAAQGVDSAFAEACNDSGVEHEPHPANWDAFGRRAGPMRNEAMVNAGAALCIAVHRDIRNSKGTRDCARRAIVAGIPTWLIDNDHGRPRRLTGKDVIAGERA